VGGGTTGDKDIEDVDAVDSEEVEGPLPAGRPERDKPTQGHANLCPPQTRSDNATTAANGAIYLETARDDPTDDRKGLSQRTVPHRRPPEAKEIARPNNPNLRTVLELSPEA